MEIWLVHIIPLSRARARARARVRVRVSIVVPRVLGQQMWKCPSIPMGFSNCFIPVYT